MVAGGLIGDDGFQIGRGTECAETHAVLGLFVLAPVLLNAVLRHRWIDFRS